MRNLLTATAILVGTTAFADGPGDAYARPALIEPVECRLNLGLFTIPCHDQFDYFEPGGDDKTPDRGIPTGEPQPEPKPKPKPKPKPRPCKTVSRC